MSHEPQGDPIGDGIYRREYRGYLIDESANGFTTLRDASGTELVNFDSYTDAEAWAEELELEEQLDRSCILQDIAGLSLEAMVARAGQIVVPTKWDSAERRLLEAIRAMGIYIFGRLAWSEEWLRQGYGIRPGNGREE